MKKITTNRIQFLNKQYPLPQQKKKSVLQNRLHLLTSPQIIKTIGEGAKEQLKEQLIRLGGEITVEKHETERNKEVNLLNVQHQRLLLICSPVPCVILLFCIYFSVLELTLFLLLTVHVLYL